MIILFTVSLICAIFLHEFGHFFAARRCGCGVKTFSIGFGKRPAIRIKTKNTVYQMTLWLFGGYCELEGEMEYSRKKHAFTNMTYLRKLYIVSAGVAVNIITGFMSIGLSYLFDCFNLYYFGFISIMLGLGNYLPIPGLDGSYPFLFIIEKIKGKKPGLIIIRKILTIGSWFLTLLNVACIPYLWYMWAHKLGLFAP